MNGHIPVVTFLVSFGCNIWALTNDTRNALQLAKENGHHQITDMLDDIYNEQSAKNQSEVLRRRKIAIKEADERNKKIEKQWKKTLKKEKKEGKKHPKSVQNGIDSEPHESSYRKGSSSSQSGKGPQKRASYPMPHVGSQRRGSDNIRNRDPNISYGPASDMYNLPGQNPPPTMQQQRSGALKDMPFGVSAASMNFVANTENGGVQNDNDLLDGVQTTFGKPISESLEAGVAKFPVGKDIRDFVEEVGDEVSTPLELFLAVNGLSAYLDIFVDEDIDLKALMLLTEDDLTKQLNLGLGPRKKILQAMQSRKDATKTTKAMEDTFV